MVTFTLVKFRDKAYLRLALMTIKDANNKKQRMRLFFLT